MRHHCYIYAKELAAWYHLNLRWKVIEEKEKWMEDIPSIQVRFWKEAAAKGAGTGKTMIYSYSQESSSFKDNWEILYDW